MKPLLLAFPGNEAIGVSLAAALSAEYTLPEMRHFPDGETYVRLNANVQGREAAPATG